MLNKIKGYRTVLVGVLTIAVAVVASLPTTFEVTDPSVLKVMLGVSGVLTIVLRYLTNTPVGGSQ